MKNIEKTGSKHSDKMVIDDISKTVDSKSTKNMSDGTTEFMVQSLRRLDTQIHMLNKLCKRRLIGLEREHPMEPGILHSVDILHTWHIILNAWHILHTMAYHLACMANRMEDDNRSM